MLGKCFKCVGCEIGIATLTGSQEAAHQMVELLLVDLLLRSLRDNTTSTDVIEVIEVLCCILLNLSRVYSHKCVD